MRHVVTLFLACSLACGRLTAPPPPPPPPPAVTDPWGKAEPAIGPPTGPRPTADEIRGLWIQVSGASGREEVLGSCDAETPHYEIGETRLFASYGQDGTDAVVVATTPAGDDLRLELVSADGSPFAVVARWQADDRRILTFADHGVVRRTARGEDRSVPRAVACCDGEGTDAAPYRFVPEGTECPPPP